MQPEEKILILRKPVSIGSGENAVIYDKLTLREPTAGELDKAMAASTNIGIGILLISQVAAIPRAAVEKLCQRDFTEANEYLGGFTDDGPTDAAA
ncbi:phage tail assembly protein [Cupriavidus sp. UBA2534]|uniref:phage tail assembly protein n=1 Tax=Cupriavidus sp. UBA2534 TaxID=1946399 RepID=UPI000E9A5637|nr:phage tail assembly protein [Cupriavidus sp. UBA2534]HBO81688.1 phage tail assembly protein [Cupriavidus sp.]